MAFPLILDTKLDQKAVGLPIERWRSGVLADVRFLVAERNMPGLRSSDAQIVRFDQQAIIANHPGASSKDASTREISLCRNRPGWFASGKKGLHRGDIRRHRGRERDRFATGYLKQVLGLIGVHDVSVFADEHLMVHGEERLAGVANEIDIHSTSDAAQPA